MAERGVSTGGRHALIVEDQAVVALALRHQLEALGWSVAAIVTRGEDVEAAIATHQPELVMLDIRLAGEVDGIAAVSKLDAGTRPGIVIVSAFSDAETVSRAAALDPDAYLIKPFEERLLRVTVELAAQRHRNRLARVGLQRAERRLATIVEFSQDAIVGVDRAGIIGIFNRQAESVFGWSAEEALGQSLEMLVPAEHRANHPQHFRRFTDGQERGRFVGERGEIVGVRKSGERFFAEVAIAKVDFEGEVWLTAHIRDLTAKKELEQKMLAAQKMDAVARLSLGVAHDFNSLLSAIGCSAFLLSELTKSEKVGSLVADIRDAVSRGGALTRQLMGFASRRPGPRERLSLYQYLLGIEGLVRILVGSGVTVALEASSDGAIVDADPARLEQVIMNLVCNARDAMREGGELRIRLTNVDVDGVRPTRTGSLGPGRYAVLEVIDSGPGIPDDIVDRVFEPFFTTKGDGRGTGLGLSTVRDIAVELGGLIDFDTAPSGTTFRLWLPRREGRLAADGAPTAQAPLAAGAAEPIVMLVEDDEGLASSLTAILRRVGYRVACAHSAEDALAQFDAGSRPHVLLADVTLPGMDGLELVEALRGRGSHPRVLLMSGVSVRNDPAGPPIVMKPFNIRELLGRIESLIGRAPAPALGSSPPPR